MKVLKENLTSLHCNLQLWTVLNVFLQQFSWGLWVNVSPLTITLLQDTLRLKLNKKRRSSFLLIPFQLLKYVGHDLAVLTLRSNVDIAEPRTKPICLPFTFNPGKITKYFFFFFFHVTAIYRNFWRFLEPKGFLDKKENHFFCRFHQFIE